MDKKEQLLELLQKDDLTSSEEILLTKLLEDDELLQFYETHNKIKQAVISGSHLNYDQLYNYILLKNGNEPEDKSIIVQLPIIEEHLRNCEVCLEEFQTLNNEYSSIDSFISSPDENAVSGVQMPAQLTQNQKFISARYSAFAALSIGLIYLIMFFISESVTPAAYENASIKGEADFYITRGRPTDNFQKSLEAIENKNFDDAINYLERDISEKENDETIFYSHYILGLIYLETAEKDFLGLFPSYDEQTAANGLKNLNTAVELNSSGKFPNVTYDAYFYIGKANLMLGNTDDAKKYFNLALENKGSKLQEARQILHELE